MNVDKHIIHKLRSLPRHGAGPSLNSFLSKLGTIGEGAYNQIADATQRNIDGAALLNTQMLNLAKGIADAGKGARFLENRSKDLNKTFGLTLKDAVGLGGAIDKLAANFSTGGKDIRKFAGNLKGVVGNFVTAERIASNFGKKLLRNQQIITNSLQLSDKQANAFELYSSTIAASGADQLVQTNAIAKEIEAATGQQGLFKEIVGDIANLTSDLQIQYGRIPGQLELGLVKAKALGLTMAALNKTGDSLLNIESSIGDELEYQLLSGRRLLDNDKKSLTNKFRTATLQGKASDQADILNKILEKEGKTLKNNLFARKQMSKMLGMDEAALSRALQKRSILEKLPGGESLFKKTGDELITAAKAMGATEEQIQELTENQDTRTTDKKISDALDKMLTTGIVATIKDPAAAAAAISSTQLTAISNVGTLATEMTPALATATSAVQKAAGLIGKGATVIAKVFEFADDPAKYIKNILKKTTEMAPDNTTEVSDVQQDFIYSDQHGIMPFSRDDLVIGGTKLDGALGRMQSNTGAMPTATQIGNAVAAALTQKLPNVQLKVQGDPTFTGAGMNPGQYA